MVPSRSPSRRDELQVVIEIGRMVRPPPATPRPASSSRPIQQHGIEGFFVPNQILVCNVLGKMNEGRPFLQTIVETARNDRLAVQGLLDLQQLVAETEWLKKQAEFNRATSVRAMALSELFDRGEEHFCPVAERIVAAYGGGGDGGQAFVVGTALQLLGKTARREALLDTLINVATKRTPRACGPAATARTRSTS
jgi:hypothetical protein